MATVGDNVVPINIEDEMRDSYMAYAMSVIIGRALPDVRDGLKPVHRRILFAMLGEGLTSNRRYSECAGVVGEVLKRLHPHGDSAVYDALVRMAQPWNLRYPLIDGQGNFGSVDGDPAAAYRYTECRMQPLAEAMLADIDKDTVDFSPNFDDSSTEPVVLPARVPNLLVNGAEGIAVGMASKIPPHNLREVVAATIKLIEKPDASLDELMEILPGPDFPTAGIIYGAAPIRQIYATGRGLLQLRARLHTETLKLAKREVEAIVVDEIPYQVNKARLIEKIAELVNDRKIEGISRLRDESDRRGMRIVIELKRDAVADVVINQLFKNTPLQRTFGVTMLAIVNGQPMVLTLKQTLNLFIEHRRDVVLRRTRYELAKAKARLHILEGLRIALDNIDEVIAIIRASESTAAARDQLMARFGLSEIQAQQILDMPLRRLTALERQGIEDEYAELLRKIELFIKILTDAAEVNRVIIEELREVTEKFGDERRTEIETHGEDIELEDLIAEEDMIVSVSHRGYIKRCSPSLYRAQRRGGKGVLGTKRLAEDDDDFVSDIFVASTHAYLLVFTNIGKIHWIKVYHVPEAGRTARGRAIVNMLDLEKDESVSAILPVRHFEPGKSVVMVTRRGVIKRVNLMDFANVRRGGIRATSLDEGDVLIGVQLTDGGQDCLLTTRLGMSIRFPEEDARVMGRTARGVRAISLGAGDEVVTVVTVPRTTRALTAGDAEADIAEDEEEVTSSAEAEALEAGESDEETPEVTIPGQGADELIGTSEPHPAGPDYALLSVCQNGYGKQTRIDEYRVQSRGGKGLIDIKTTERNGPVIGSLLVAPGDHVMLITTAGKIIRIEANNISRVGRNTLGVRVVNLDEGEAVAATARVADTSASVDAAAGDADTVEADILEGDVVEPEAADLDTPEGTDEA